MEKLDPKIQNYIKLVYSEKSDLNFILDLDERKKEACKKSKLDPEDEKVKKIIAMKDEKVNQHIFEYLSTNNSSEFTLLMADHHLFNEIMHRQLIPLKESDDGDVVLKDLELKTKMSLQAETLLHRIKERRRSVFKGEKEQHMADEKIRMMRPEERLKEKNKST